jgi:hypothetical protein
MSVERAKVGGVVFLLAAATSPLLSIVHDGKMLLRNANGHALA